jgi:F-type H+-transporting ATPase subunit delta
MRAPRAAVQPYARALHSIAKDRNQTEAIGRDLATMVDVVARDPELRDLLARSWIATAAKRATVVEVATRLDLSPLVRDFVGLVAKQGRAEHLAAIAEAYRNMVDEELGRVRARVRTAVSLTESERAALRAALGRAMAVRDEPRAGGEPSSEMARRIGKPVDVILEEVVDPNLLGGFVAEIGSSIVDGSLDGQLARIEERLARG